MRKFFYARVSSESQSLDRQLLAAQDINIDNEYVFVEKASGKDFKRPEYTMMKRMLREGDILYIKSLDRLGRNKQMILDEWQDLIKIKKIDIVVLDMPLLDTTKYKELNGIETLISDLILQLLSYMAEDERKRIKERQAEGIMAAKLKGIKLGRRKIENDRFFSVYNEWKHNGITAVEAFQKLGMKKNTFYRRVKEFEVAASGSRSEIQNGGTKIDPGASADKISSMGSSSEARKTSKRKQSKYYEKNKELLISLKYQYDEKSDRYYYFVGDSKTPVTVSRYLMQTIEPKKFKEKIDALEGESRSEYQKLLRVHKDPELYEAFVKSITTI